MKKKTAQRITLKCNVSTECGIFQLSQPKYEYEIQSCPTCDKQVAYAVNNSMYGGIKLQWNYVDTEYNEAFGGYPVQIM